MWLHLNCGTVLVNVKATLTHVHICSGSKVNLSIRFSRFWCIYFIKTHVRDDSVGDLPWIRTRVSLHYIRV